MHQLRAPIPDHAYDKPRVTNQHLLLSYHVGLQLSNGEGGRREGLVTSSGADAFYRNRPFDLFTESFQPLLHMACYCPKPCKSNPRWHGEGREARPRIRYRRLLPRPLGPLPQYPRRSVSIGSALNWFSGNT